VYTRNVPLCLTVSKLFFHVSVVVTRGRDFQGDVLQTWIIPTYVKLCLEHDVIACGVDLGHPTERRAGTCYYCVPNRTRTFGVGFNFPSLLCAGRGGGADADDDVSVLRWLHAAECNDESTVGPGLRHWTWISGLQCSVHVRHHRHHHHHHQGQCLNARWCRAHL